MSPARLFIALWPDARSRVELATCRDRWRWPPGAAPVADAKLHLTLHFIGAFAAEAIESLGDALAALVVDPVELRADAFELWKGGIAVLRLDEDPGLARLHAATAAVLGRFDVALEARPFRAHVTLARKARGAVPPPTRCELAWRATGFALVESAGGVYRVIRAFSAPG